MKALGILIIVTSVFCYSLLGVLLKKASQNLQPFTVMAISMFVLFGVSFLFSIAFEKSLSLDFSMNKTSIMILVAVGIINVLGFWLQIKAYPLMPLWTQQMFFLLTPIFGGIIAYIVLKEPITSKLFAGLAFMIVGLFIAVF